MLKNKKFNFIGLILLVIILIVYYFNPLPSVGTASTALKPKATWLELGPDNKIIARAITEALVCPKIKIDNDFKTMQIRSEPSSQFPVLVCQYESLVNFKSIEIAGKSLAIPKKNPNKIVVIGDTGCHLKGNLIQDCNNPQKWPFSLIAKTIAKWQPDLVIHIGDYLYRESPCPVNNSGCSGSTFGDSWQTWEQDFFAPTEALLSKVPWIFVRGNHELCSRAGGGWFKFLDPASYQDQCQDYSEPYKTSLGDIDLVVMDTALANDNKVVPVQVDKYSKQFKNISAMLEHPTWLLTHRPIWGLYDQNQASSISNETLYASNGGKFADLISLIISGHIHVFEILSFEGKVPLQSISGNGGTYMDQNPNLAQTTNNEDVREKQVDKFGFTTLVKQNANNWLMVDRDINGSPLVSCQLSNRSATCQKNS